MSKEINGMIMVLLVLTSALAMGCIEISIDSDVEIPDMAVEVATSDSVEVATSDSVEVAPSDPAIWDISENTSVPIEIGTEYSYVLITMDVNERSFHRTETGDISLPEYNVDDTLIIGSADYTNDDEWNMYVSEIYGDGSYECCLEISEQYFPEAPNVYLEYCTLNLIGNDEIVVQMKGIHTLNENYTIKKYVLTVTRNE